MERQTRNSRQTETVHAVAVLVTLPQEVLPSFVSSPSQLSVHAVAVAAVAVAVAPLLLPVATWYAVPSMGSNPGAVVVVVVVGGRRIET